MPPDSIDEPDLALVGGKKRGKLRGKKLLYSVSVFISIGVWLFGQVLISEVRLELMLQIRSRVKIRHERETAR